MMKYLNKVDALGSYMHSKELTEALENPNEENNQFVDQQVIDIIKKQEESGLQAITDGELRLKSWDKDFFFGFNGVEKITVDSGSVYQDIETQTDVLRLNGRIEFNPEHPVFNNFRFLKQNVSEDKTPRQSMPSPALFFLFLIRDDQRIGNVYENLDILADDIIIAYRKTIRTLYNEGCRSVKFDDPTWGFLYDDVHLRRFIQGGVDMLELMNRLVRINTGILAEMPADLQKIMHVCRHSHSSTWTAVPDYSEFANYAFNNPHADEFMIDCALGADFSFLQQVNPEADVVLGLSDPWSPQLVEPHEIKDCVMKAAEYFPLEKLSISPRAGFCSKPENLNAFEPQDQWRKIAHLQTIASEIWK